MTTLAEATIETKTDHRVELNHPTVITPDKLYIIRHCLESPDGLDRAFANTILTALDILAAYCTEHGIRYEFRGGPITTAVAHSSGIDFNAEKLQTAISSLHRYASVDDANIPIVGPPYPFFGSIDIKVETPPNRLSELYQYMRDHLTLPAQRPHELPNGADDRLRRAHADFQPKDGIGLTLSSVEDKPELPLIALELVHTIVGLPNHDDLSPTQLVSMDFRHFPLRPIPLIIGGIHITPNHPTQGHYDRSCADRSYNVDSLAARSRNGGGGISIVLPPRPAFAHLNADAYRFYSREIEAGSQTAMRLFVEASVRAMRNALVLRTPFTEETLAFSRWAIEQITPFWHSAGFPHLPVLVSHLNLEMEVCATINSKLFLIHLHNLGLHRLMHPRIRELLSSYEDITTSPLMQTLQVELHHARFPTAALERAIDSYLRNTKPPREVWILHERTFLTLCTSLDTQDIYTVFQTRS